MALGQGQRVRVAAYPSSLLLCIYAFFFDADAVSCICTFSPFRLFSPFRGPPCQKADLHLSVGRFIHIRPSAPVLCEWGPFFFHDAREQTGLWHTLTDIGFQGKGSA